VHQLDEDQRAVQIFVRPSQDEADRHEREELENGKEMKALAEFQSCLTQHLVGSWSFLQFVLSPSLPDSTSASSSLVGYLSCQGTIFPV
jgi:hypothetical protein